MASSYELLFKASLDTTDVQQKLNQIKQLQDQLQNTASQGNSSQLPNVLNKMSLTFDQGLNKLGTIIQNLQRTVDRFLQNNGQTSGISRTQISESSSLNRGIISDIGKTMAGLQSSLSKLKGTGSDLAIANLQKSIANLQSSVGNALKAVVQAPAVKQPVIVQPGSNMPPVAPPGVPSTKRLQLSYISEIKNFREAYKIMREYVDSGHAANAFKTQVRNYREQYAGLYNANTPGEFQTQYQAFRQNLQQITDYLGQHGRITLQQMQKLKDATNLQFRPNGLKTRIDEFRQDNPQYRGVDVRANDLRRQKFGPGFNGKEWLQQNRRILGAGSSLIFGTLAHGHADLADLAGEQSKGQVFRSAGNIAQGVAMGGLMGGIPGAALGGLTAGITEALQYFTDSIKKTAQEVEDITSRMKTAKEKDAVVQGIYKAEAVLKAVKTEDIGYLEEQYKKEKFKRDKAEEILDEVGADAKSFQKYQQRIEVQRAKVESRKSDVNKFVEQSILNLMEAKAALRDEALKTLQLTNPQGYLDKIEAIKNTQKARSKALRNTAVPFEAEFKYRDMDREGLDSELEKSKDIIDKLKQSIIDLAESGKNTIETEKTLVELQDKLSNAEKEKAAIEAAISNDDKKKAEEKAENQSIKSISDQFNKINSATERAKYANYIDDIANDKSMSTKDRVFALQMAAGEQKQTMLEAKADRDELMRAAMTKGLSEDKRKELLDKASKDDQVFQDAKAKMSMADRAALENLQDQFNSLKAPDMQNVNSLASQGYMISKSDDNERLNMQTDFMREQTRLQKQIRDKMETISLEATYN